MSRSLEPFSLDTPTTADREGCSILFLGLARDCEKTLPNFFRYLDALDACGLTSAAIIGESGSVDRTRELLDSVDNPRIEVLDTAMMAAGPTRLARMAIGRQALLDRARSLSLGETYVCVADLDNVMLAPPSPASVQIAIDRLVSNPSLLAVGATSFPVYYDLLALRTANHDYSSLYADLVAAKKKPFSYFQFHQKRIYENQRLITRSEPIECTSTFNGFCLYNAQDYYKGSYRSNHEASVCEHVSLNFSVRDATGKHMLIAPELVLQAPADHFPVGFFQFWFDRLRELLKRPRA
jgi:hypothetical protein